MKREREKERERERETRRNKEKKMTEADRVRMWGRWGNKVIENDSESKRMMKKDKGKERGEGGIEKETEIANWIEWQRQR